MNNDEIEWVCHDCGNTVGFTTVWYEAGDADVECDQCHSRNTGEKEEQGDEQH